MRFSYILVMQACRISIWIIAGRICFYTFIRLRRDGILSREVGSDGGQMEAGNEPQLEWSAADLRLPEIKKETKGF